MLSLRHARTIKSLQLTLTLGLVLCSFTLLAQDDEDADYLSLAALMIKDGQHLKAGEALEKVDTSGKKFDWTRYHTLRGLVFQAQELHKETIDAFQAAIEAGQEDPLLHVYIARAWFSLKEFANARQSIAASGDLQNTMPALWKLKAGIELEEENYPAAWEVFSEAQARFPDDKSFLRQRFFLALKMQLFLKAADLGREYLQYDNIDRQDYIAIANALTQSGEARSALEFLEEARFHYPEDSDVYLALAHAYLELDQEFSAAMILEEGSLHDAALSKDAAELYRRSNNIERALFVNTRVIDQKEKLKQRLGIYLEGQKFEQIVAMENDLIRIKLTEDETIRYALAYAFYKTGDFEKTETLLQTLTDSSLFRKSAELRKSMASCKEARWLCL